MSANLDWRRIEAALEDWFRRNGIGRLDTTPDRNKQVRIPLSDRINLTLLAQDLAKELEK